ncbi:hypothetical protein M3J09_013365 [Ascochyta lentis]
MQPINIQNLSCGRFTSRCRASYREPVGSASSSADCLQASSSTQVHGTGS